jgi:phosphoribosylformimino-5-aminoimidazole carboxamide ribotide isomerase
MIQVIPAIDIMDGKCVRLTRGDYTRQSVYADDPLDAALQFEAVGIKRLHVVDLDGAKAGTPMNLRTLERIAESTELIIDHGGGIKSDDDLSAVFNAGAEIANIGSVAVRGPERFIGWIDRYGSDRFLLGADSRNGMVAIDGWQTVLDLSVIDLLRDYCSKGVRSAFVTDIDSDGAMSGPATELYRSIIESVQDIHLIASGGVSSLADIETLDRIGCSAVIVGKALYEGRIDIGEIAKYAG